MRGGEGDFGIVKGEIGNEEGGALVQEGLGWDGQGIQKERAEDGRGLCGRGLAGRNGEAVVETG